MISNNKRTIGRTLITSVILITMLSLLVIIGTFMGQVSKTLELEIDKKIVAITKEYGQSLEMNLRDVKQIADTLEVEMLTRLGSEPLTADHIDQVLDEMEPFIAILARNSNQGNTAYVYIDPTITGQSHDIYYADQNGDGSVERQNELEKDYYNGDHEDPTMKWWYGPKNSSQPYWTKAYDWVLDNGQSIKFVSYTKPLIVNGQFIGIVGSDLLFDELEDIVKQAKFNNKGFTFLIDSERDYLIFPDGLPYSIEEVSKTFDIQLVNTDHEKAVKQYRVSQGNVEWFSSAIQLSNDWIFGIAIGNDVIFKEFNETVNIMIVVIFFVVILVGIAFYWVGQSIGKPIVELADYVDELENADYEDASHIRIEFSYSEVERLSHAILQMMKRIRSNMLQIQLKNLNLKEQNEKNEEMRKKLEMSFEALSSSNDGILILDKEFQLIYYNQMLLQQFSLTKEDIEERLLELFPIDEQTESLFDLTEWEIKLPGEDRHINLSATLDSLGDEGELYLLIYRDISSDLRQQVRIQEIKMRDLLTGLYNRHGFEESIDAYLIDRLSEAVCPLLLINIDNFRSINDSIGFQRANSFLKKIACILTTIFGEKAIIARTNGDEYGVFIKSNFKGEDSERILIPLINQIGRMYEIDDEKVYFNFSVGVSLIGIDAHNLTESMGNAHSALNYAKNNYGANVAFFNREILETTVENYQMIKALREAISNKSFEVVYQPKWDTDENICVGLEALARWQWQGKYIQPDIFIKVAEQNNLMLEIGEIIFEQAVNFAKELVDYGYEIAVSVNISGIQFKKGYFDHYVFRILDQVGLEPRWLEIELTESILMHNHKEASELIKILREGGIESSIDDFGKGYSSLSYLKNFKVNTLKVDRAFIKDIPDKDDGTLAELIIKLGKMLGVKVVTEGVETKEQLDFVNNCNCHVIQGYYFSKPLSGRALKEWLKNNKS